MISGILAVLVGLVGWLLVENKKRKSAEALLDNQKSKEEITKISGEQQSNNASLKVEEEKREEIHAESNEEKSKLVSDSELLDFFKKLK